MNECHYGFTLKDENNPKLFYPVKKCIVCMTEVDITILEVIDFWRRWSILNPNRVVLPAFESN